MLRRSAPTGLTKSLKNPFDDPLRGLSGGILLGETAPNQPERCVQGGALTLKGRAQHGPWSVCDPAPIEGFEMHQRGVRLVQPNRRKECLEIILKKSPNHIMAIAQSIFFGIV